MKKISIVVPIYNLEKNIEKCINSLVNQTYKNIEIILINDGSTDRSGEIALEYKQKYPNIIKYFEKENGGLSDARNYGVKYVTGDYISFIDGDDYITENLYADLEEFMNKNYDIIHFKIKTVDENGKTLKENYSPIFYNKNGEEAFEELYKNDEMMVTACSYLYRKEFFIDNNFKYEKGLYHEDFGLTPLIILKAKKVASTDVKEYNYVQTTESITRGNNKTLNKRAQDLLVHYDNMIKTIKEYNISERTKENIKIYYTNCIILKVKELAEKYRKQYISEIKKRKMLKNIKVRNLKQLIKKMILTIDIKLYLKLKQ